MRYIPLALLLSISAVAAGQSSYQITKRSLLGGDGGWDYVVPDPPSHRLYIARQTRLMVVDEESGKLIGEVADIHGAHGTAVLPSSGHGFATSSLDQSVNIFDLKTLKVVGKVPAAEDADGIILDESTKRVFTMNGDANSSTAIDGVTGKVIGNVALGGKPEYAASSGDGMIYANLADKNEIVEINAKTTTAGRRWSTAPCEHPVSMAIDTVNKRLFSGCRSGVLAISDYAAGKVITTVPIGKGVDGTAYDPATGDIFVSNADGTLNIIHEDSPDTYRSVQTLTTPVGSRNLGLDPVSHKIYLVSAQFGPPPATGKRPAQVPNTFTLLTVEKTSAGR